MAAGIAQTDAYVASRRERLRLRGPNGARAGIPLAAAAHNLRKMAKLMPMAGQSRAA